MKRILAILLSFVMSLGMGISAYALPEEETPIDIEFVDEYSYTDKISSDMSISNNTATCKSVVRGDTSLATKIVITQTLQKKNGNSWTNVTSWSKTFNTWYAMYSNSKSSLNSGTYRLKTVAKVYSGNNYETITVYSRTASC
ncbi:hypothetical protein [Ruminococcus sp.]|uniref:hypothetical protein n=1 Tax=Ruminococcus sp. TaxID=41978 RepID=UPI0025F85F9E|nr:hypothetical protein [Ruminococcus sp.]MBQ8966958.1 hypothetical protein [Ruminococcus sp.]